MVNRRCAAVGEKARSEKKERNEVERGWELRTGTAGGRGGEVPPGLADDARASEREATAIVSPRRFIGFRTGCTIPLSHYRLHIIVTFPASREASTGIQA